MEDKNRTDIFENDHTETGEVSSYVENDQDCEEGRQDHKKKPEAKAEGCRQEVQDGTQSAETCEESSSAEEAFDESESSGSESQEKTSVNSSHSGHSYYTPPNYTTSYTASYGAKAEKHSQDSAFGKTFKNKENKGFCGEVRKSTLVIFLCFALLLGTVAGFLGSYLTTKDIRDAIGEENFNIFGSPVQVTKNDGSIKVNEVIGSTGYSNLTVSQVAELVADSVVEISTQTQAVGQYVSSGAGSGVIFAQGGGYGYIVSNYHVVGDSDAIKVRLTNGNEYTAEYLDGDELEDIAVIRIQTEESLTVAVCGSSSNDSLHVGEEVVAIGNPLGKLGGTVTNGIISALNRSITIDGVTMELLQTNAAVNPGNSGGGLFNMAGELIGIVNAKKSSAGIEGLGFAIPIDNVYGMLLDVLENGYIQGRVTFGIDVAYADAESAWRNFRTTSAGIYVVSSTSSNFAYGDWIYAINDRVISTASDYYAAIADMKVGDSVTFTVYRNMQKKTVKVVAQEYVPGMFS